MSQIDNIYLLSSTWFTQNYWWILLIAIVVIGFAISFFTRHKKTETSEMDEETMEKVIACFGGLDNLVSAAKDGARLKFSVVDVDKCRLEGIKELGATGIFVTGKQVKFLFPLPSDNLLERINSK